MRSSGVGPPRCFPRERPQQREVQAANGFSSQHDTRLHFGLGATAPELIPVRIRWCGGATTEHRLPRDGYHVVRQGGDGRIW